MTFLRSFIALLLAAGSSFSFAADANESGFLKGYSSRVKVADCTVFRATRDDIEDYLQRRDSLLADAQATLDATNKRKARLEKGSISGSAFKSQIPDDENAPVVFAGTQAKQKAMKQLDGEIAAAEKNIRRLKDPTALPWEESSAALKVGEVIKVLSRVKVAHLISENEMLVDIQLGQIPPDSKRSAA